MTRVAYDPTAAAVAGALYLDAICPGWAAKVDTKRLDLNFPSDCILGQVYGNYYGAIGELKLRVAAPALGFTAPDDGFDSIKALTTAWVPLVQARQLKRFKVTAPAGEHYIAALSVEEAPE